MEQTGSHRQFFGRIEAVNAADPADPRYTVSSTTPGVLWSQTGIVPADRPATNVELIPAKVGGLALIQDDNGQISVYVLTEKIPFDPCSGNIQGGGGAPGTPGFANPLLGAGRVGGSVAAAGVVGGAP